MAIRYNRINLLRARKKIDNEFIRGFLDIKVKHICNELGANYDNIRQGIANPEATRMVRNEIERRMRKIMGLTTEK